MLHKTTITSIERHVSSPSLVSSRAALRSSLKGLTLLSQQSTSTGSTLKATYCASRSLLSSCLEDYDTAVSCALTYCALKPDDTLGPTLLSAAVLGATSQGVLHSLASLGLSQCTHLLLHPLSCTSCFQPMNVPVASTALGLMTCAACFAGSPRDSEGGPHRGGGEEQKSSATAALLELSLDPRWAVAVEERLKGNAALARKDLEGAVEAFTLATTPTPSHFTAWSNLSHVLLKQGKVFDSLGAADAAVAHSPPFYAKGEWRRCRAMAALGWKGSAFGALLKFVARGTLAGAASVHRLAWALTLKGDVDEVEEGELGEEEEEEGEGEGVRREGVKKEGDSAPPTAASAGAAAVAEEEEEELAPPPPPLQDHEALELLGWCREHAHRVLCATVLKDGGAHTLLRKARSLVTLPRYQSFSIRSALGRSIFEDLATLCTEYFQQVREEEEKEREKQQQQQQKQEEESSLTLPPAPPFPPTQAVLKAVEEAIASVVQRVTPLAPAAIEEKARLVSMGWWGGCGEESIPAFATSPPTTTTSSTASETGAVAVAPAAAAAAAETAPRAAAGGAAAPEVVAGEERWSMGDATPQPPYLPASIPASKEALCCYVCFDIQYEPVALPECGHSLCRPCLQRVLDHKPQCPVCRSNASSLLATQSYNTAIVQGVLRLVLAIAPCEAATRREGCAEERSSSTHTLPVFVCSLALPHSPTPLHIFEPRYRLMVRRCVQDKSRRFGMVPHDPTAPGGYPSVGVSLFVRRVRLLPDGRSYVNCLAEGQERRFRVLERGMSEGGYSMCKVEWLKDSDSGRELEGVGGWEGGLPPPSSQGDTSSSSSSTDVAASFQFLKTYVEGILHASRAKTLVEVEALLRSDGFENEEGAEALSPSLLMAAAQGCRVIANVLEDGLPPVPPLTPATAQEWLWWVAGALPCSDRLKYQWLSALSWGRRMELVSSFVQDSTIASPATFALRVGAIAGSGQHCGIQ